MATSVITNRYHFPPGYRRVAQNDVPGKYYSPYNGFFSAPGLNPTQNQFGAEMVITAAGVPADLSLMTVRAPNGREYVFQFVYNASVQNAGIKIPLPNSGASTAAQVSAAILAVLAAGSGTPFGSSIALTFPWVATASSATANKVSFNVAGASVAGTYPANISEGSVVQGGFGQAVSNPGRSGFIGAFLPSN